MMTTRKWTEWALRNRWLMATVVLPVLLSAFYFFLIASDQYVSESRFVIRAPNQRSSQVTSFASLIQTTGLSGGQEQANQVMDFVRSRSALEALSKEVPLKKVYGGPDVDFLSRFPTLWEEDATEDFYKYYGRKVQIERDTESGLVVLRTIAFSAKEAALINEHLLRQSESLVNELNKRARGTAIVEAENRVIEAEQRVAAARKALSSYRNSAQIMDPAKQAVGVYEVTNRLIVERAALEAQLSTLQRLTPDHPSIPSLRERIGALGKEIEAQTARVVGGGNALSSKLPNYEALELEQEFASQMLVVARSSLEQARAEALKQQYYLERVVNPNVPDLPEYPHAFRYVLTILGFALCLYFIAWMFIVGILEHAPED